MVAGRAFFHGGAQVEAAAVCAEEKLDAGGGVHFFGGVGHTGLAQLPLFLIEAEETDDFHSITIEKVEDEHFLTVNHEMTKTHFISFIAYLTSDRVQFVKFYPEGNGETRLNLRGSGWLYIYCNRHGLMKQKI